nr:unnamed protein product [Spirometra erinaceieuropaei]
MGSLERLDILGEILTQEPRNNDYDLYCRRLEEAAELYRAQKPSFSSQPTVSYSYLMKFSNALVFAYDLLDDAALGTKGYQDLLKSMNKFQDLPGDENGLNGLDASDLSDLAVALGHLACKADRFDLRTGFRAWKFFSQFLSTFRQQLEVAFSGENSPENDKRFQCDNLIECLLTSAKENFKGYLVEQDTSPRTMKSSSEPLWRSKLKLVAFICRLFVGCLRQFAVCLFLPTTVDMPRAAVKFIEWAVEIKHAGGLFLPTILPEYLLKDLETTVFVALTVSLSSMSLIPNHPEQVASAAAIAISNSEIPPLIKCRIYLGVLDGLSQQSDAEPFALWMCDDFNIYHDLFKNVKIALSSWNPHGSRQSSDFAIPKFLNLDPDRSVISSSVEQFLTDMSIQVCRSARSLTAEFFPFLETALLDTVLHSSPVISLVAQDIWCFLARYGSADLCWQYVTLLGNAIICLAERYEAGTGPMPPRAPLQQLSRLGNLLSRLTVFLTARQQREFLSCYPLSDRQNGGTTDKSILWRFLNLRLPHFHPSVRALLERQVIERVDYLLTQQPSTFVCLAISQDLNSALLASNAVSLTNLSVKVLTDSIEGESQLSQVSSSSTSSCPASSQERTPLAAPHLLHLTDYPLRVEAVVACISRWIPRLPQFCSRGDPEEEPSRLLQLLLRELQTACRNGLSYTGLDAVSRWLLNLSSPRQQVSLSTTAAVGESTAVASPTSSANSMPALTFVSTSPVPSPLPKPLTEQHSPWLAPAFRLLSRTTTKNPGNLTDWLAGKIKEGTPTYGLAKWLFQRLKFVTSDSNTTVSSSTQSLEKLKGDLVVETIELLLREKYDETENHLGHAQIIQLLKFCLKTYFSFDGTI